MAECRPARGAASIALAIVFISAPLATAHGQPASRRDEAIRTRVLAWPAGDRLFVGVSADVRYVQGPSAKAVITGPNNEIEDIVVDRGVIRRARQGWDWQWWRLWKWRDWRLAPDVHIVVTAPHVAEAGVSGSAHLDLGRLAQDRLRLWVSGSGAIDVSGQIKTLDLSISGSGATRMNQVDVGDMSAGISGSGWIKATGAARSLHLSISGSGMADLGGLTVQDAEAQLSGSGSARLSPKQSADLSVSGSGSIRLLTEPPRLSTHRAGSGSIFHPGGSS